MSTTPTPLRYCDLVMKGGITSGVVYPLTAVELSKRFRFKNIGGTSAGAIAAAATAAAELGRDSADGGFKLLEKLPGFLGEKPTGTTDSNLFHFFQPQPATRPIFEVFMAALGGGWRAVPRVLWAALKSFWIWPVLVLIFGLGYAYWATTHAAGGFLVLTLVLALVLGVGLALACLAISFARCFVKTVPTNLFGLCSGMPDTPCAQPASSQAPQALTPWLSSYLNRLAGRADDGPPLTFFDLWGTRDPSETRRINLEMMTTCLSHGRPYRLPFRHDDFVREGGQFYFHRDEFRQVFPEEVVVWMEQHPRAACSEKARESERELLAAGYCPLPEACDLPVIVAVRMSLSFPVLLSAVPLYAVDFGRKNEAERTLERCWFSDGGIASNFPVHFFDSLLPRWPTFAITLSDKHPDHPPGTWLPSSNSPGTERWTRFDHDASATHKPLSPLAQLGGFFGAILNSMQNWADNTQARLPGYRDRVAVISLSKDEGGLNLNMPAERISRLAGYGREAGVQFARRFASPDPGSRLDWQNQRWVRLRSTLACLEESLLKIDLSCANPLPPDEAYDAWIRSAENDSLPSYPWVASDSGANWKAQRQLAVETLAALRRCAQDLRAVQSGAAPLSRGAPKPRPELRIRPRI